MMRHHVFALAILIGFAPFAFADDFAPPPYRDTPLSYTAGWNFDYDMLPPPDPMPADFEGNGGPKTNEQLYSDVFNLPTVAKIFNMSNMEYNPQNGGWTGGPQTGFIDFNLPNWIDDEPIKYVRVQLTYLPDPFANFVPSVNLIEAFDLAELPGTSYQGIFDSQVVVNPGDGVLPGQLYEDWVILPNPDWEIIKVAVPPGVTLLQTVIDTVSVPEPMTVTLLAMASLVMILRRR